LELVYCWSLRQVAVNWRVGVYVQVSVMKGEQCTLLDNSRRTKWRVRNSGGVEGLVPAICFYIPPPNKDAEELARTYVLHVVDLHG